MNGFYNRKSRRKLAKQLGLKKKNETLKQFQDRVGRANEAGRQIHQAYLNEVESEIRNSRAERESTAAERASDEELERLLKPAPGENEPSDDAGR